MQRTELVYIKLVMTMFFWGGTFVAGKWAVGEAPPFFVATLRFAIASVLLWALVAWRQRGIGDRFPVPGGWAQWAGLFSLGLTGVFLYNFVFLTGLSWTSATSGSLIVAFNPLLTAVLSALWLKERIRPAQAGGLLLALLGVGVVVTRGSIAVMRSLSFNPGDLLMLGAPLAWALYTILGKKVLARFSPLVATAYASLFGTLLLLPAAALEGSLFSGVHRLTVYGWISVLQLALLGTVVGFVWWYEGVEALGASRAAVFVNLVPIFGVLLSALILSESLEVSQLAGGILVVLGVGIGTLGGRENRDGASAGSLEKFPCNMRLIPRLLGKGEHDMDARYGFGKTVSLPFDAAVEKVTQELQKEGFGVLTDIDVSATLKKKLSHEMPPYRILGACNPPLAHRALEADPSIGLLLPCNVVVRQDAAGKVHVEFMDPNAVLDLVNRAEVSRIASEVRQRLVRVMQGL